MGTGPVQQFERQFSWFLDCFTVMGITNSELISGKLSIYGFGCPQLNTGTCQRCCP